MSHWQEVAKECGTDKWTHGYMPIYERFLGPRAPEPLTIVEIGIDQGRSLDLWRKLFPNAQIHGVEYRGAMGYSADRVTIHERFGHDPGLAHVFGPSSVDVIVDDGSHLFYHHRLSQRFLWPCLRVGGLYFIEDILTDAYPDEMRYWSSHVDCVFSKAWCKDVFGRYNRASALAVFQKRCDRGEGSCPESSHERWPAFFRHMESKSGYPENRQDVDGDCIGWLERPEFWRPLWRKFIS